MDLTLQIEKFKFIRNHFRKKSKKEKLLYKTDGNDQFLKRNQVYARKGRSLWQLFKQLSLGFREKLKLDDIQPEVRGKPVICRNDKHLHVITGYLFILADY